MLFHVGLWYLVLNVLQPDVVVLESGSVVSVTSPSVLLAAVLCGIYVVFSTIYTFSLTSRLVSLTGAEFPPRR